VVPWVIAICAIALQILALVVVRYVLTYTLRTSAFTVAVRRGDLLIPALILCVETMRRWCFDVKKGRWFLITVRILACLICGALFLIAWAALAIAATVAVTPDTGDAITAITVGCLVAALVFGTWAVIASATKWGT
jgi:hypothetical protein